MRFLPALGCGFKDGEMRKRMVAMVVDLEHLLALHSSFDTCYRTTPLNCNTIWTNIHANHWEGWVGSTYSPSQPLSEPREVNSWFSIDNITHAHQQLIFPCQGSSSEKDATSSIRTVSAFVLALRETCDYEKATLAGFLPSLTRPRPAWRGPYASLRLALSGLQHITLSADPRLDHHHRNSYRRFHRRLALPHHPPFEFITSVKKRRRFQKRSNLRNQILFVRNTTLARIPVPLLEG